MNRARCESSAAGGEGEKAYVPDAAQFRVCSAPLVARALRCARDTKRLTCRKNDLTRVTRIFQKRAFTKAEPGWETAAGFFVGSACGPDALEK